MKLVLAFALVVAFSVAASSAEQPQADFHHHDVLQQFPVPSDPARRPVPLSGDQSYSHNVEDDADENMEGAESRHYHKKGGHKGGKKWGRK